MEEGGSIVHFYSSNVAENVPKMFQIIAVCWLVMGVVAISIIKVPKKKTENKKEIEIKREISVYRPEAQKLQKRGSGETEIGEKNEEPQESLKLKKKDSGESEAGGKTDGSSDKIKTEKIILPEIIKKTPNFVTLPTIEDFLNKNLETEQFAIPIDVINVK